MRSSPHMSAGCNSRLGWRPRGIAALNGGSMIFEQYAEKDRKGARDARTRSLKIALLAPLRPVVVKSGTPFLLDPFWIASSFSRTTPYPQLRYGAAVRRAS